MFAQFLSHTHEWRKYGTALALLVAMFLFLAWLFPNIFTKKEVVPEIQLSPEEQKRSEVRAQIIELMEQRARTQSSSSIETSVAIDERDAVRKQIIAVQEGLSITEAEKEALRVQLRARLRAQ